jgi:hypothetical protein
MWHTISPQIKKIKHKNNYFYGKELNVVMLGFSFEEGEDWAITLKKTVQKSYQVITHHLYTQIIISVFFLYGVADSDYPFVWL